MPRHPLATATVLAAATGGLFVMAEFPQAVQRSILMGQFIACFMLLMFLVGRTWYRRGIGLTLTTIGGAGIFLYLIAGQQKALSLNIPFDWYSWIGVVASGLFIFGAIVRLRTDQEWR